MNKSLAIDTSTTHFTIACENNGVFIEYSMDNCLDHAKNLLHLVRPLRKKIDDKNRPYRATRNFRRINEKPTSKRFLYLDRV